MSEHDREGLVRPVFTLAEVLDGRQIPGIAGQKKASQPLDGQVLSLPEKSDGRTEGIFNPERMTLVIAKIEPRPAEGTGVRLSMKPPVSRVFIFMPALRAHL